MMASTGSWEKDHKDSKLAKKSVPNTQVVAHRRSARLTGVRMALHGARWGAGNDLRIGPELARMTATNDPIIAAMSPLLCERNAQRGVNAALESRADDCSWVPGGTNPVTLSTAVIKKQDPNVYHGTKAWLQYKYPGKVHQLDDATWSLHGCIRHLHGATWVVIRCGDDVDVSWRDPSQPNSIQSTRYAQMESFVELCLETVTYLVALPLWYTNQPPDGGVGVARSNRGFRLVQRSVPWIGAYVAMCVSEINRQVWVRHCCRWHSQSGCHMDYSGTSPGVAHIAENVYEVLDGETGYHAPHVAIS
jgi:hypothetical protein